MWTASNFEEKSPEYSFFSYGSHNHIKSGPCKNLITFQKFDLFDAIHSTIYAKKDSTGPQIHQSSEPVDVYIIKGSFFVRVKPGQHCMINGISDVCTKTAFLNSYLPNF